ncbi:hypothetical protein SAMN05720354_10690 [Nitrosospira sp. Nsp1]|nr:hypothetical protein SAMN05720354_10690 [Nitrosospira sp. Nsp1]
MNMPQFNAEVSLDPTRGIYRGNAISTSSVSAQVFPSQNLGFGFNLFPQMRCCGFVPSLGRFVCTSRQTHPLENCECRRSFLGYSVIICRDAVNALA